MTDNDRKFSLPPKVDSYLDTLNRLYDRQKESLLRELVVNATVAIHEGWDHDNWNGGTYGHAVTLTVAEDLYVRLMDQKDEIQTRLVTDLNKLDSSQNEYVSAVFVEMQPPVNDNWREETDVYHPRTIAPPIAPEALERIWGSGHVRVFLSHKATVKDDTSRVKQALERCGIAAFVAHENIKPTEEWPREIERALSSMDALIALLSEDFHDSDWTDQEVGFALGRKVPLIAVCLGMDPYGLMGKSQGLRRCSWDDPDGIAVRLFELLHKRLPDKSRLFECALSAYARSCSFADSAWKVENLLSVFETLTGGQVKRVLEAYNANSQNTDSFKGMGFLQPLLEKWTGEGWAVRRNRLVRQATISETETPF